MLLEFIRRHWKIARAFLVTTFAVLLSLIVHYHSVSSDLRSSLESSQAIIKANESKIQSFNSELSLSKSTLVKKDELISTHKKEIESFGKDFNKILTEHKLELLSREKTIASLRGAIKGGSTNVIVNGVEPSLSSADSAKGALGEMVVGYAWKDPSGRFKLNDPDILNPNDETFEYSQKFLIKGHVFSGKDGKIQINRVLLQEVVEYRLEDGSVSYEAVQGQHAELISSDFEYAKVENDEKRISSIFKLRALALFDTSLHPGIGIEAANIGRYFNWANVGVYGKIGFDVSSNFKNLQNSTIGFGLLYTLLPPVINSNFAIGASLNLPFNDLRRPAFMLDAIFYLTN